MTPCLFYSQNTHNRHPHNWEVRVGYGVIFIIDSLCPYLIFVTDELYAKSRYTGPRNWVDSYYTDPAWLSLTNELKFVD